MIPVLGRQVWIFIWYGILLLGVVGLGAAVHWGYQTRWANREEILRGIGTITVSVGFLFLLYGVGGGAGYTLMIAALIAFVLAFIYGRDSRRPPPGSPGPS